MSVIHDRDRAVVAYIAEHPCCTGADIMTALQLQTPQTLYQSLYRLKGRKRVEMLPGRTPRYRVVSELVDLPRIDVAVLVQAARVACDILGSNAIDQELGVSGVAEVVKRVASEIGEDTGW